MRDDELHGVMFALAAAAIAAFIWARARSRAREAPQPSAFSWLSRSGSAEAVFGKPYAGELKDTYL